jgi:hypothetical protein
LNRCASARRDRDKRRCSQGKADSFDSLFPTMHIILALNRVLDKLESVTTNFFSSQPNVEVMFQVDKGPPAGFLHVSQDWGEGSENMGHGQLLALVPEWLLATVSSANLAIQACDVRYACYHKAKQKIWNIVA